MMRSSRSRDRKSAMNASDDFIRRLPKAELHIHIEGSFEPRPLTGIDDPQTATAPKYRPLSGTRRRAWRLKNPDQAEFPAAA